MAVSITGRWSRQGISTRYSPLKSGRGISSASVSQSAAAGASHRAERRTSSAGTIASGRAGGVCVGGGAHIRVGADGGGVGFGLADEVAHQDRGAGEYFVLARQLDGAADPLAEARRLPLHGESCVGERAPAQGGAEVMNHCREDRGPRDGGEGE